MKKIGLKLTNILIIVTLIIFISCEKRDFKKLAKVETKTVSEITSSTAKVMGDIIDLGVGISDYGHCWGLSANPTITDSKTSLGAAVQTGLFTSILQSLISGKNYHVRAYLKNGDQILYGTDISFTTSSVPSAPTIGTAVSGNAQATVTFTAPVSNGGSAIISYTVTSSPESKTGTGTASPITVTGLTNRTSYTFTVKASNAIGTSVASSASNSVTPLIPPTPVTDVEGNVYNSVVIGLQVWMKENLKTTKYNDGTAISNITVDASWAALTTPGYCYYNNDAITYKGTYGALYNWYTVDGSSNGGKNLCPTNWHVPTYEDWTTLVTYLGGDYVAGGKMKEIGITHWLSPNTGATNVSGFSALPSGLRTPSIGRFSDIGTYGVFWSSTVNSVNPGIWGWCIDLGYNYSNGSLSGWAKKHGLSVRCLRDF